MVMGFPDPELSRRTFAGASAVVLARMAARGPGASAPAPGDVRVTDDDYAAHIEPSIAANPRDPDNLIVACRVFLGPQIGVAAYCSFDAGRSWHGSGLMPDLPSDFDGNPTVAFDPHGCGYVSAIRANGPGRQPRLGDALLWRTDDGGRTFRPPVTAIAGGGGLVDHPWLAIEPTAHGDADTASLYMAATMYVGGQAGPTQNVVLVRSFDRGRSFDQPRRIDPTPGAQTTIPVLAAGGGGRLCALYFAVSSAGGTLRAVTSADRGETLAPPVDLCTIRELAPDLGSVTAKSGPAVAASARSGHVYAAVTAFDESSVTSSLLLLASADHGRTWSAPVVVASSGQSLYLQPQLAVDGRGRVGLSVYALSIATVQMDVLFFLSESPQPAFGPPRRVTSRSFDPRDAAGTGSTSWIGNYQGLAARAAAGDSGAFCPVWTDTRTGGAQIFTAAVAP